MSVKSYFQWLHGQWPSGTVETLPQIDEQGRSSLAGVYVVGDLTGVPLLKFALDSGVKVARRVASELSSEPVAAASGEPVWDVAILGGGVSGMAAALECQSHKLRACVIEAREPFSTIANFPAKKPIFTYPTDMQPEGTLQVAGATKEALLEELRAQIHALSIPITRASAEAITRDKGTLAIRLQGGERVLARRVIVAIGRSGNFRRLGVPGEDLAHVSNRLIDPTGFAEKQVVVVGGGDSALEAALALQKEGASISVVHRQPAFSRAKPANSEAIQKYAALGQVKLAMNASVVRISPEAVEIKSEGGQQTLAADHVLVLIGREPPLDFFARSKMALSGQRSTRLLVGASTFFIACVVAYGMKAFGWFGQSEWHPSRLAAESLARLETTGDTSTLRYTITASLANGIGFVIAFLYCTAVVTFGIARIKRRNTPYVTRQTLSLIFFQCVFLFLLPEVILPWLGHHGLCDSGIGKAIADELFPAASYDHNGREYWRAYGFILAWPLFVWNVFTQGPMWGWLAISLVQTFVIIPVLVWRFGKGAYCGWICSCGALAETMGDRHRHKMPRGQSANRWNMVGQVLLAIVLAMLAVRALAWATDSPRLSAWASHIVLWGWKPGVDFLLAGVAGTGLYFLMSGRVWCRFACPLAALMHVYARFSRFRIVVDSKKCISCSACTAICHQGIDVMGFASRGHHLEDPECVRCSACVTSCPTGVLQFGQVNPAGQVVRVDRLVASAVVEKESAVKNQGSPS